MWAKCGEVDEGNIAELRKADIIFSYSHSTWTNQDVEITISLSEAVQNKEKYRLEYSKDNKNWSKYAEDTTITMTQNGKIYARTKDISGDIKIEGGYAEGEVTIIDKEAPTPGNITMKMASLGTPYEEGTEVYQNVAIELEDGQDEEEGSGHKATTCEVTGIPNVTALNTGDTNAVVLKTRNEDYKITATITTEDNAGNISTVQKEYTVRTIYAKETKPIETEEGTYYIPEGFKLAEDTAKQISKGIVIEDKSENQYVWIQCTIDGANGSIKYDRYDLLNVGNIGIDSSTNSLKIKYNASDSSSYSIEKLEDDEKNSIEKYNGYYIGRYEAGDKESTEAKKLRESSSSSSNEMTIKKGQVPYNYISQTSAKSLASNMSVKENYSGVITKITSGYAWDTAIKFISKDNRYSDYATSYTIGNYRRNLINYKDINNIAKTKKEDEAVLIPTGQTEHVLNIYDMAGNLYEWTTEIRPLDGCYSVRGGYYNEHRI